MKKELENRALFTVDAAGAVLQGTCHLPVGFSALRGKPTCTGILFLQGLSSPRTANGDSAVYWATAFAESGYPAFRIDLPGLGDSAGESPSALLDFINAGGNSEVIAAAIKNIVERYHLAGVVILGHCAGATSAIYSGALSKHCKGLILMAPYFHLPQATRPRLRRFLSSWAPRNRFGGFLSNLFDRVKSIRLLLRGDTLPPNANFPILKRWKEMASAGLPILVIKSPEPKTTGAAPRTGEFDYLQYVTRLAGSAGKVDIRIVEGGGHTFSNRAGRTAVKHYIHGWLTAFFPRNDEAYAASAANHEQEFVRSL